MSSFIQLSIADPCHEDWEDMTPAGKGRFCGSCQKQVVDFSLMSDEQLLAFFKKPVKGSVCGRFTPDQLDRPLLRQRKKLPWGKYFFRVLLPAFFFGRAQAQEKIGKVAPVCSVSNTVNSSRETVTLGMVLPSRIIPAKADNTVSGDNRDFMQGRVYNDSKEPVGFASVQLLSSGQVWVADSAGRFFIPSAQLLPGDTLECSAAGYLPHQTVIANTRAEISLLMEPREDLPEVVVTASSISCHRRYVLGGLSILSGRQLHEEKETLDIKRESPLQFYPNPVRPGATVNVKLEKPEAGYYLCQLLTIQGQSLFRREYWIDEKAGVFSLELPVVPPGTYMLLMTGKEKGRRFQGKLVVI